MTIIDGCNIDNNGRCLTDAELCCLACRHTGQARYSVAGPWLLALECLECLEDLAGWAV